MGNAVNVLMNQKRFGNAWEQLQETKTFRLPSIYGSTKSCNALEPLIKGSTWRVKLRPGGETRFFVLSQTGDGIHVNMVLPWFYPLS